ncbi:MAG: phosphatidylglycerophosphatase A [Pikeienuella sp.]|uniref:phosphatidylglycerophosphatase A n=1 Tax=Pikeienuella sp. TaxID=2831957 RepID=UPI00391BC2C7
MSIADRIAGVSGLHRLGEHSGLFAALAALPLAWGLHWLGGFPLVALATGVGALKVLWAAPRAGVPMIADRMIGQLLALWPLSGGLWAAGVDPAIFPWPGWVGGFLACQGFTLFFPPLRRLERFGPLWDDAAAGALAAALVLFAAAISHGWLA